MSKIILYLCCTVLILSCNKPKARSSRNVKLVTNEQLQRFANIYSIDAKYGGGRPEGLYIYQKGNNFFGKYYETSPNPRKYKIRFLKVIGDTLKFRFEKNNEAHYWELVNNSNGSILLSTNYDDEYVLNKALDAARPLMNGYKRFYKELMDRKI